ncbi:hypothetical protein V8D89_008493 [Ganoderma adspersum]
MGCPPHIDSMSTSLSPTSPSLPVPIHPQVEPPDSARGRDSSKPALNNTSSRPAIQPRNQSPPKRDPACEHCTTPMVNRHLFDQALAPDRYAYGEIVKIRESVQVPIKRVLTPCRQAMVPTSSGGFSWPRSKGKKRPGVVLGLSGNPRLAKGMNGTKMVLMATFNGKHKFDNLPRVLRHFCMPISPHYEIGIDVEHIHTTPEWQKDHVWAILPPCVSSGKVFGRWEWKDEVGNVQKECSFKLDEKALSQLADTYKKRFGEWSAICLADEGYQEECLKEYLESQRQDAESSVGGSPLTSQASLEPQVSPSRVSKQVEPRANEDAPSPPVLPPQPLPDISDVAPEPSIPQDGRSPSHSRHTSASGRLIFGDTLPLDLNPANRLGVNFGPKIEDWLSKLEPSPGHALQGLPGLSLGVPGEPSAQLEEEEDWETTSAATTESVHDDAELIVDMRRATLGGATMTSPPKGAPAGVGVDGPAPTEDNDRASRGEAPTSTSG